MGLVRSRDTKPEKRVRSLLHALGYRFRVRGLRLPGRPDVAFTARKKVIFVHGCFWHRHHGCARTRMPKSRTEFWSSKFQRTMDRDRLVSHTLTSMGWEMMLVWECESERVNDLKPKLIEFLGAPLEIN